MGRQDECFCFCFHLSLFSDQKSFLLKSRQQKKKRRRRRRRRKVLNVLELESEGVNKKKRGKVESSGTHTGTHRRISTHIQSSSRNSHRDRPAHVRFVRSTPRNVEQRKWGSLRRRRRVCVCVCIHAGRRPCFIKDAMRRSLAQLLHF